MPFKFWFSLGTVAALIAVATGALGDHWIAAQLNQWYPDDAAKRLANWQTASRYLFYHALGCCLLGILPAKFSATMVNCSGWLFLAGMILFSGGLFAYTLTNHKWLVALVPLGGVGFLVGWSVLAFASFRLSR